MKEFLALTLLAVIISATVVFIFQSADKYNGMSECVKQGNRAEDCEWMYRDFIK